MNFKEAMNNKLRRIISAGSMVILDDEDNVYYEVVRQSNNHEYTWITNGKSTWEVKTSRLTLWLAAK